MVYERPGRGHSSPGYSYSGKNYYREPTPEEKEQARIKEQKKKERQQLEQTALQSTLEMSDSAEKLVTGRVVNQQKVWQGFLQLVSKKYGTKVARLVATTTSEGKVSISDLVGKEVPKDTAVAIYQDWNSLWSESVNKVSQSEEAQINQVFQAGIPATIVGTYGTTLGTKVIWRAFGAVIASKYGAVAAQALGLSAADGLLPVGEAIAFGLLAATAIQIARNWDELWAEAEKILVSQEPEPQIYTTPTDEQVEIPRTTGHVPEKRETGTPGYETPQVETPRHTGHETEKPDVTNVFESNRRDLDSHDAAGGHTRERHVGKSTEWLRQRIQNTPGLTEASSFDNAARANLTQARFVKENKEEIDIWLKSSLEEQSQWRKS